MSKHKHDTGAIKVRAIEKGYYGEEIREIGDEFGVHKESEIGSWMERLDGGKTEKPVATGTKVTAKPADTSGGEVI